MFTPLRRGFFCCVVRTIHMYTLLALRPVDVRLKIAYMVDAAVGGFTECNADNSAERFFHENGDHPYHTMWDTIGRYFTSNGWNQMSDAEIMDLYKSWISTDTDYHGKTIKPMDVLAAKRRWEQRGWYRYEHKRNGRRKIARLAVVPVLACFGVVLPQ